MILSFSIPEMRPMIEAGLRQRQGEDVGGARVKRQTIRRAGPRAYRLIEYAQEHDWNCPYPLHLWWKSRTPEREHIGTVPLGGARCWPVLIERVHASAFERGVELHGDIYVLAVSTPGGSPRASEVIYAEPDCAVEEGGAVASFARQDGFESATDFRDFFVPKRSDVFEGIVYQW